MKTHNYLTQRVGFWRASHFFEERMHRSGCHLVMASRSSLHGFTCSVLYCLQASALIHDCLFLSLCTRPSPFRGLLIHSSLPAFPAPLPRPISSLFCHYLLGVVFPVPPSLASHPVCTLTIPSFKCPVKTEFTIMFYLAYVRAPPEKYMVQEYLTF